MSETAQLIRAVQAARRSRGVDDETHRAKLKTMFGVSSTKDLTVAQLVTLRAAYNGDKPQTGGRRFRPAAQRADQRLIYAQWRELRDLGGVKADGPIGLQTFLEGQCGRSAPEHMDQQETSQVTEALKAMIRRRKAEIKKEKQNG